MLHSQQQTDMEMSMWRDCKPTKNYAQQSAHCLNDLNVFFVDIKLSTGSNSPLVEKTICARLSFPAYYHDHHGSSRVT